MFHTHAIGLGDINERGNHFLQGQLAGRDLIVSLKKALIMFTDRKRDRSKIRDILREEGFSTKRVCVFVF